MSINTARVRLPMVFLGIGLILGMVVIGFSIAAGPEGAAQPGFASDVTDLFGVRILDSSPEQLAQWGIEPLGIQVEEGVQAHVTEAQLERLRAEGVAFVELGRVAVISSQSAVGTEFCSGSNPNNVDLPAYMHVYEWSKSDIHISCAPGGATVTSVAYTVTLQTQLPPGSCPSEGACGHVVFQLCDDSKCMYLDSQRSCCNYGDGDSVDPDADTSLREGALSIAPGSEGSDALGAPVLTWSPCTKSGTTSEFNGHPVNQTWSVWAQNTCWRTFYDAYIDEWELYVYYWAEPTPTPTCPPGSLRVRKYEDLDRDGEKDTGEPPVEGASFRLKDEDDNLVDTCTTNASGVCYFSNQCEGRYRVVEVEDECWVYTTPKSQWADVIPGMTSTVFFGNSPKEIGLEISKTLMDPVGANPVVSDTIEFLVVVTNTGEVAITDLWLVDKYNPTCLAFVDGSIPNNGVDAVAGKVYYGHVLTHFGGTLPIGANISFTVRFHAEEYCQPAQNCISITQANGHCSTSTNEGQDCVRVDIDPVPCTEAIQNGRFENGLTGWVVPLGKWQPMPVVQSAVVHNGSGAVKLGGCYDVNANGQVNGNGQYLEPVGWSAVRQTFHIPENVTEAPLTFWYKVETEDGNVANDYFQVQLHTQSTCFQTGVNICENTGWVKAGPFELGPYAGEDATIGFYVYQDGNFGCTTAYIDDVKLCAETEGTPGDKDPPPGTCWKPTDFWDYAPNGVPDFSMKQAGWRNTAGDFINDGPVAVANSLWWMDSRFEEELAPLPYAPPQDSDHYELLEAYGAWDDHATENVVPFVRDIARHMGTNDDGTTPSMVYDGVVSYLESKELDDQYTVTLRPLPSPDWIQSEVLRCEDVMLLLGFWENQAGQWARLGGHWVTVPGTGCEHEMLIGLSDPWFDRAEQSWDGEWYPGMPAHPHPQNPPDKVHNDAEYVSHDLYPAFQTYEGHALAGYAPDYAEIEQFFGLNVPTGYETDQAVSYMRGDIVTRMESAIAVSPYTDTVILRIDPALNHVNKGEIFELDVMVDSGDQGVRRVELHLNFNRSKLRIVKRNGNTTDEIIPGEGFDQVTENSANNSTGRIDFKASRTGAALKGSYSVATLRFKAVNTSALGAAVEIVTSGERRSRLIKGVDIPYEHANGAVIVSPGATLEGNTTMEGRAQGPKWKVPLHVTLHEPGEETVVGSYHEESDNAGDFTVSGLGTGTFDVAVKGSHTLRTQVGDVVLGTGTTTVNFGTLLEGDTNNDNVIDLLDVWAVQASYGKSTGDAGFNPLCDFNENGSVGSTDISMLLLNFGKSGDGAAAFSVPSGASAAGDAGPASAGASLGGSVGGASTAAEYVTLELHTQQTIAESGDIVQVELRVDSGTTSVDALQVHLTYDRDELRAVDAEGVGAQSIKDLGVFDSVIQNSADNSVGEINFVASASAGQEPSGSFTLARMWFRVRFDTPGAAKIRFATMSPRYTRVVVGGEYALVRYMPAQVSILGPSLYLPLVVKS